MTLTTISRSLNSKEVGRALAAIVIAFLVGRIVVASSAKQILFLLLGLITISICVYSLRWALYLLIIVVIALPTTNELSRIGGFEVAGKTFSLAEIIYGLLIIFWLFQVFTQKVRWPGIRGNMPIYGLFLLIAICALTDVMQYAQFQNTIMGLKSLSYYGVYFIVISVCSDREDLVKIHNAIIAGILLYCSIVISMYLWGSNPLLQYMYAVEANLEVGRISFANGISLSFGLPLLVVRWCVSESGWERFFCALSGIIMSFVLILSGWRTGWLITILSMLILFVLLLRKKEITSARFFRGFGLCCFAILVIGGLFYVSEGSKRFMFFQNRLATLSNIKSDSSLTYRIERVKEVVPGIMEHLILGSGFSTYYYDPKTDTYFPGSTFDESHTRILRMLGLSGYALFVWIFVWFFKKLLWIYRSSRDKATKELGITFLAYFPCMVILSFTCIYLVGYDIIFIFAIIFALVTNTASHSRYDSLQMVDA